MLLGLFFFFKQKTAYEMRISDWSSDVCSSDLVGDIGARDPRGEFRAQRDRFAAAVLERIHFLRHHVGRLAQRTGEHRGRLDHRHLDPLEAVQPAHPLERLDDVRSEEHTSELQSLMRISYAVFCLKKKKQTQHLYIL